MPTERFSLWLVEASICLAALALAAGLLALTVATFDRCLGRISEQSARRRIPPERRERASRTRETVAVGPRD